MGSLSRDETVLIHNAGGGVGLACIDVARHIGAHIIGTASSGKHAILEERGLHAAVDYRTQYWPTELRRLTDGRCIELITDPLCVSHWKNSYSVMRSNGSLGMFGLCGATETRSEEYTTEIKA